MRRVTRSLSPVVFAAIVINLFTLGCTPETQTVYVTDVAESADVETLDTEAPDSADVTETEDTADTVENTDTATPGPGVIENQCEVDEECSAKVECGEGLCIPFPEGKKCLVIAKVNFCEDGDPCTIDSCNTDPQTAKEFADLGCNHKTRVCDDHNACTKDLCDNAVDGGCTSITDPEACNDFDACTQDICLPGGSCDHNPMSCDDGLDTNIDGCVPATGCYHTPVECKLASECLNPDPCLLTGCVFGKCQSQPLICDDGVLCTTDFCAGGDCAFVSNCSDNSVCSNPECNVATGACVDIDISCNDGNPCTADGCTEGIGCTADKIPGCCLDATECNDGDACTFEFCDLATHTCVIKPITVDDKIKCTVDSCLVGGGISNVAVDELCLNKDGTPLEGNKTHCSNQLGCVECTDYLDCDDGDACTNDNCDWAITGTCSHEAKCNAPQVCTLDGTWAYCGMPEGYCTSDTSCNDNNACTVDICNNNICDNSQAVLCKDTDKCNLGYCHPIYGCSTTYMDCDDGDICTTYDQCNPDTGACEYKHDAFCQECTSNSDCVAETICIDNAAVAYSGTCSNGRCFFGGVQVCQDYICHTSSCQDGACTFEPKDCDDADVCTFESCDADNGCEHKADQCNDYNPCTIDSCDQPAGCKHTADLSCGDPNGSLCKGYWNCKECSQTSDCVDSDPSTLEECSPKDNSAICLHKSVGDTYGIGIGNFSQEDARYSLDLEWEDGSYSANVYLEPTNTVYRYSQARVMIHSVTNADTGVEIDAIPLSLACISYEGILTLGVIDPNGVFTCQ